jgi:transposase-like protein
MKLLRTLILFNQGNVMSSEGWATVHQSYKRAIETIYHPPHSGALTLRRKARREGSKQFNRNGVGYLRNNFLHNMVNVENWQPEHIVNLFRDRHQESVTLYPSLEQHYEPITSDFGGFDFLTTTPDGVRVAIEWETGNISSSHRALNKLSIALKHGTIQAGVLILPSKDLYVHLTDRIGNISEISGYLEMWQSLRTTVSAGLLAVTVVEHDELTGELHIPYLPTANDGRAQQGRTRG